MDIKKSIVIFSYAFSSNEFKKSCEFRGRFNILSKSLVEVLDSNQTSTLNIFKVVRISIDVSIFLNYIESY